MATFRRFDPYALITEDPNQPQTLASLVGLADATFAIENLADVHGNQDGSGIDAKVAKPAKVVSATPAALSALAEAPVPIGQRKYAAAADYADQENRASTSAKAANLAKLTHLLAQIREARGAVVEYGGTVPRAWADGFTRLDLARPPVGVPPRRWRCFIDDVARFFDSPFCAVAAALGWDPLDLFGCDCDRPFARIDQAGLLWLLNGDRLIALSEKTATVKTRTGARQTWRRRPSVPSRVLPWDLQP